MIGAILSVADRLMAAKDLLSKARRDRRDRASALFTAIGETLEHVSKELRADRIPHGACAELGTYAERLAPTIDREVGAAEAGGLASDLAQAREIERVYGELQDHPDRDAEIAKIEQAGGTFRALGNILRAS